MKNGRYEEYGELRWYKDGLPHREDGPAVEMMNGYKAWYVNGEWHRLDGPARIWPNGDKEWYRNGLRHRLDGPSIEYADGLKVWCVEGREVDIIEVFGYEPSVPLSDDEQFLLLLSH